MAGLKGAGVLCSVGLRFNPIAPTGERVLRMRAAESIR